MLAHRIPHASAPTAARRHAAVGAGLVAACHSRPFPAAARWPAVYESRRKASAAAGGGGPPGTPPGPSSSNRGSRGRAVFALCPHPPVPPSFTVGAHLQLRLVPPAPAAYLPPLFACIRAGKELNARRSPKQAEAAVASTSAPAPAPPSGGSSRGEKFRAIKAREAASKAVKQVGGAACGGALCACGWLHGLQGVRRQSGAAKQVGLTCRYGCGCLG